MKNSLLHIQVGVNEFITTRYLHQVTPAGIELNPLGFGEGACDYILKRLVLSGRVLQGLVLARAND